MADVKLPQLGESVTEGTLGKWLKQVGDLVSKYEPIVEITTDKVNAEVSSDYEGVLQEVFVREGETVRVGTVICRIQEGGQERSVPVDPMLSDVTLQLKPTPEQPAVVQNAELSGPISAPGAAKAVGGGRYSPAVLQLAQEHQVDLRTLTGSGDGGRITRKDVLTFVASQARQARTENTVPQSLGTQAQTLAQEAHEHEVVESIQPTISDVTVPSSVNPDVTVMMPSAVRKTIAKRMVESKQTAPHAWTMVEADVSALVSARGLAKTDFKRKEGIDLTFMPFFIKAVVEGLKQYPMMNASWVDDRILLKKRIHISIAVATDDALVVPVIQDADRLSIAGIAHATNDLAARARSGRLTLSDVQGGTFTVNNTGAFGSILSQPIINTPQAAILSFESIVKRPVVVNDAIAIRSMINLSLSLDHRLLDGWVAGQFLRAVRQRLESFGADTLLY